MKTQSLSALVQQDTYLPTYLPASTSHSAKSGKKGPEELPISVLLNFLNHSESDAQKRLVICICGGWQRVSDGGSKIGLGYLFFLLASDVGGFSDQKNITSPRGIMIKTAATMDIA